MAKFLEEVKGGAAHAKEKEKKTAENASRDQIGDKENFTKFSRKHLNSYDDNDFSNVPAEIQIPEVISIKNLAAKMNLKVSQLIKKFLSLGITDVTVNDTIDAESVAIVCAEFRCEVKVVSLLEQTRIDVDDGKAEDYETRPPIVAIMGHVDHGKTTLVDAFRKSSLATEESGGITQHIDAYQVKTEKGAVTFIDTPGHIAFSAMRARGVKITDMVILLVSAVDGVRPQTIEAIEHIKKEKVLFLVAVNKCDLEGADPERVKNELAKYEIVPQEWGGETIFVNISALKGEGLDKLLESILLLAELHEIKGNKKAKAHGYVLECRVEQGRGNVVDIIVKNGVLRVGDVYLCGRASGKVRAMHDRSGHIIEEAVPSTPVRIMGIADLPIAGELFQVMESEKEAKGVVEKRIELMKEYAAKKVKKVNTENFMSQVQQSNVRDLKILLKADVFGTVEALKQVLLVQRNDEVRASVVYSGTGAITEGDVTLAETAGAVIIAFRVKTIGAIKKLAEKSKVEVLHYDVIYDVVDEVHLRLEALLKKERIETLVGSALVKEIFKLSSAGKIAGCFVEEGKVERSSHVKIYRENELLFEGEVAALKRYKDDVKEVKAGSECGLQIKNFEEMKVGDVVKAYDVREIKREFKASEEV